MRKFPLAAAIIIMLVAAQTPVRAQEDCTTPEPVCAARAAVFTISAFDPFASAVRISADRLVTNRHVVADQRRVKLTLKDGREVEARVIPTGYQGDLALIESDRLGEGPMLGGAAGDASGELYTVGGDVSRRAIRVYPPGRQLVARAEGAPFARLHHSAYSQPGNSGGALVDARGRLVGIVASGGEGRFEAVPASELAKLMAESGEAFSQADAELGTATRTCTTLIETAPQPPANLDVETARRLTTACARSANRQLFDLAAQTLGRGSQLEAAIALSEMAVERDPNAINSRLTLVTSLHIAGRFAEELPHLKFLLDVIPDEPTVHRYAVQAGKWGGDQALAARAIKLIEQSNPAQADPARRFLEADIPPPQRR